MHLNVLLEGWSTLLQMRYQVKCGKSDRTIANDTTLDNYVFFSLYTSIQVYIQGYIHEFGSNTTECFYSKPLKIAWISNLVNNLF